MTSSGEFPLDPWRLERLWSSGGWSLSGVDCRTFLRYYKSSGVIVVFWDLRWDVQDGAGRKTSASVFLAWRRWDRQTFKSIAGVKCVGGLTAATPCCFLLLAAAVATDVLLLLLVPSSFLLIPIPYYRTEITAAVNFCCCYCCWYRWRKSCTMITAVINLFCYFLYI